MAVALPGGQDVLFTIAAQSGGLDAARIAVLDLRTHSRRSCCRVAATGVTWPTRHRPLANRAGSWCIRAGRPPVDPV